MDLQTVENKLKAEDYTTEKEFENDIELIWNNALTFNYEGSDVYNMALEMQSEFKRLL